MAPRRAVWFCLLVAACGSGQTAFTPVRDIVRERTGSDTAWRAAPVGTMAAPVRALLGRPLDAEAAVQIALWNNTELQAEFERVGLARGRLLAASLPANPEVSGHWHFVGDGDPSEPGVGVMANLSQWARLSLTRSAASAELEMATLKAAGAAIDLAGEVRRDFHAYQAAEQVAELYRTVLAAAAASYEIALRLYQAGNVQHLELANEAAFYEDARLDLADAELEALQRRERLHVELGLSGTDTAWTIVGRLPDPPEGLSNLADLERKAVENSLDLRALERGYVVAATRLRLARLRGLLPDLRLGLEAEREDGRWEIGPAVSIELPLFDGGQGQVATALAESQRAAQLHAAHAVRIRSAVRQARDRLVTAQRRAQHFRRVILPLHDQIVTDTQRQYNAMQVGVFQLLSARRAQIHAGRRYVLALADFWRARASLDQVLAGRLVPHAPLLRTEDPDTEGDR